MNQHFFIYELVDPIDGQTRYIGQSISPQKRYAYHIFDARYWTYSFLANMDIWFKLRLSPSAKQVWISSLLNMGGRPILRVIEQCDQANVNERENYWINFYIDKVTTL